MTKYDALVIGWSPTPKVNFFIELIKRIYDKIFSSTISYLGSKRINLNVNFQRSKNKVNYFNVKKTH